MDVQFTHAEKTVRKYTNLIVFQQAKAVLKDRYNEDSMCTNRIRRFPDDSLFTLEDVNDLVEGVIDDTLYYQGRF